MSRRKQSRPRSVKVVNEDKDFPSNLTAHFNDDKTENNSNDGNNNSNNSTDNNHSASSRNSAKVSDAPDKLPKNVVSPSVDGADVPAHLGFAGEKRNLPGPSWSLPVPGVSSPQVKNLQHPHRPTPPLIPPNFLISSPSPSSSSVASSLFSPQFLPPPPHLIPNPFTPPRPPPPLSSSSPLPPRTSSFDEMARRKKSPKSITPWRVRLPDSNQHEDNNSSSKLTTCQICPAPAPDGSSPHPLPVEGHEYFIDPDGTLTIKNGVCPRSLALMLFTQVFAGQGHYKALLGENLVKFLLNLKQIVEKHQFICPEESPLQWVNAQNVLKEYAHGSALKPIPSDPSIFGYGSIHNSNPRKRPHPDDMLRISTADEFYPHEITGASRESEVRADQNKNIRDRNGERSHMPDNFLVEPLPTPSPSPSHSPPPLQKPSQTVRRDKKGPDSGLALTPSGSERDQRDGASDSGSVGGASSRVTSPAPSVSSVTSSLSLAEAAKQMANTKRGSKILPIASGDGGTRYLCPVCALELPNDHELTVHIRSHNSQNVSGQVTAPNSCTICGKTLSSQSSLDRHMLVHSGERPFRCKICDMSFTTNGNMHRHARIHEKNGSSTPKPPGRKPSSSVSSSSQPPSSSSSKASRAKKETGQSQAEVFPRETSSSASTSVLPPLMTEFGSDKLDLFKSQQDPSAILQYYNDMSLRMGQLMFPFGSHHPAFPYQHMMTDSSRLPYLSPLLNPFTGEVLAKRARLSSPGSTNPMMAASSSHLPLVHLARETAREQSPDLREQQSVKCSMCPKVFSSQWSLDAHMESHIIVDEQMEENSNAKCKVCKTVTKSEESLLLHTLTHHPSTEDLIEPDNKTSRKSPSPKSSPRQNVSSSSLPMKSASAESPSTSNKSSNNSSIKSDSGSTHNQGFQDLNFACFTGKKFPLIAKAFCEEECKGSARAVRLPVFPCSQCTLEFPVEGARDLHEVSHLPEEYTVCPTCKCHFSSSSQLQLHMLKHVADLHFDKSRDNEDPQSETMTQNHFLAQFGLVTKDIGVLPSSMLEGILEVEQEQSKEIDVSRDEEHVSDPAEKTQLAQFIKSEVVAIEEGETFETVGDTNVIKSERSAANEDESFPPDPAKMFSPHKDKFTEKGKASSSPSLKISSSLFGGKAFVKSVPSRSPSPLSLSGSDLVESHDDSSMPPLFPCKHCGVVLPSPRALKHHQRSHHETAQFRCQVCSYTSTDKSTLLRHMRTHSGERPYKCAVCDYSFTTKANCERHLRQKHGFERNQMAGKIKCNQYIIASSSLSTSTSVDEDKLQTQSPQCASSSFSSSTAGNTRCPSCLVDFYNFRGLQQHFQVSPHCRMGYLCLKCKVTFPSRKALISHMSSEHPSVLAQDYNRFTASLESAGRETVNETVGNASSTASSPALITPPPAHSHTKAKTSPITSSASSPVGLQQSHQKQLIQSLPANILALLPPGLVESASFDNHVDNMRMPTASSSLTPVGMTGLNTAIPVCDDDQPLDFSSTGRSKLNVELSKSKPTSTQKRKHKKKQPEASHASTSSDENCEEDDEAVMSPEETDGPIDLSVTRMHREQPLQQISPAEVKAVTLAQGQAIPPNQAGELAGHAEFGLKVENTSRQPLPLFSQTQQTPSEINALKSHRQPQKHPAFPQLVSMMTSPLDRSMLLQGVPAGAAHALPGLNLATAESSSSGESVLALQQKMTSLLPGNLTFHPSVFPTGNLDAASQVDKGSRPLVDSSQTRTANEVDKSAGAKVFSGPQREVRHSKQGREHMKDSTGLVQQKKIVTGKGSSSESDSSCDLASVNKILDATDAQRFQGFLNVGQTEDEQGYRSESIESGEDSNTSLENMYCKSLTSGKSLIDLSKSQATDSETTDREVVAPSLMDTQNPGTTDKSGDEEVNVRESKKTIPPVTVNVALINPVVFDKTTYKGDKLDLSCKKQSKPEVSDPSNMSEQAIAALIAKVSRENVCSPAKKKRNSYADSPHKFSCPYCSRCFPWLSSLNRHLLTHTGQKPFKCPRCPVTFSTKSNRERHLIRKHNVNMLDPSSRVAMDRPYKCHLCAFSSFTAQCNLLRHYRDRHPEMSPPSHILEDAAGSDGEADDIISYEDEEEYNSLAEQASLRGLSDRDIMLQNYSQDGDSNYNYSSNSNNNNTKTIVHDTHKKRNAVFTLDSSDEGTGHSLTGEKLNSSANRNDSLNGLNIASNGSSGIAFTTNKSCSSTRPGIDDTVLTDTMKNFLDKSVRQALEDSHRRAMEEGSKFVITPAIERHLRSLSAGNDNISNLNNLTSVTEDTKEESAQCAICDKEFPTRQILASHMTHDHELELPYRCHLCDMAFCARLECLQHLQQAHRVQWADMLVRNNIGNIQVFATRLDKMIMKISKRQAGSQTTTGQENSLENGQTSEISLLKKSSKEEEKDENSLCSSGKNENIDAEQSDCNEQSGDEKNREGTCNNDNQSSDNTRDDGSSDDGSDKSVDDKTGDDEDDTDTGVLTEVVGSDYHRRKVHCSFCPKRYWAMVDLRKHMRSHTGERPHECSACERRFSLKNSLTRHITRHHASQGNKVGTSEDEGLISSSKVTHENGLEENHHETPSTNHTDVLACNNNNSPFFENSNNDPTSNEVENPQNSKDAPHKTNEPCKEQSIKENGKDSGEDMLHDLLGVESSTIDQIFDARDSAASLLGV